MKGDRQEVWKNSIRESFCVEQPVLSRVANSPSSPIPGIRVSGARNTGSCFWNGLACVVREADRKVVGPCTAPHTTTAGQPGHAVNLSELYGLPRQGSSGYPAFCHASWDHPSLLSPHQECASWYLPRPPAAVYAQEAQALLPFSLTDREAGTTWFVVFQTESYCTAQAVFKLTILLSLSQWQVCTITPECGSPILWPQFLTVFSKTIFVCHCPYSGTHHSSPLPDWHSRLSSLPPLCLLSTGWRCYL